jgi:pyroglutamyl-peptidase
MRILVTGFEPFGGETINPSWEVARALHDESIGAARVTALMLPCRFGESGRVLAAELAREPAHAVIALGQAARRTDLSVERVAINIDDAPIPDNAGDQPIERTVIAGAPAGYFSTLPIRHIVAAMRAAGLPASVSQTAGTFVCNHLFFHLAHLLVTAHPHTRGGFIHLPMLPQQAASWPGMPSLSLETMIAGVRIAVATTAADDAEPGATAPAGGATVATASTTTSEGAIS